MLIDPPLVNFTAIFGAQGVAMHIGMPPPASNAVDSPMQAWTDSISSPETEPEEVVIQTVFTPEADIFAANAVALQSFHSGYLPMKTYSAAQIDSLHFAQAVVLGLTPFATDSITQVSIISMCAKKACLPSPFSLHLMPAQKFSFISVIAGKRTVEALSLFPQPPKKVARIVEILEEEHGSTPPDEHSNGLATALEAADNALTCSPGPSLTPLTTAYVSRSPRAN